MSAEEFDWWGVDYSGQDGGWQTTEESSRVTWTVQEETREANAEMGGPY